MKRIVLILVALVFTMNIFGQIDDKGESVKNYQVEEFNYVRLDGSNLNVNIRNGDTVEVTAPLGKDGKDYLDVKVKDNTLTIKVKENGLSAPVEITCRELKGIMIDGVVNVNGKSVFETSDFDLKIDGVSKLVLELNTDKLNTDIAGAGHVTLTGKVNNHNLNVSGAGVMHAYDLITGTTDVKVSGASVVRLNATEKLSGEIEGVSKINYKGNPNTSNLRASSMSVIKNTGEGAPYSKDSERIDLTIGAEVHSDNLDDIEISGDDTVKIKIGNYNILVIEDSIAKNGINEKDCCETGDEECCEKKNKNKIWAGFEMGVNGFMTPDNSFDIPAKYDFLELDYGNSFKFNLNFYEQDVRIISEYMKFVTGLGITWNNYRFNENTRLLNSDSIGYVDTINFKKSKLTVTSLNLPLLIAFNTNKDYRKAFHLAGGAIIGYNFGVRTKQVYKDDGKKYKDVEKNRFNVNPLKYGLTARLGYGKHFRVFATYELSTLFKDNVSPELYPFSVGITLINL